MSFNDNNVFPAGTKVQVTKLTKDDDCHFGLLVGSIGRVIDHKFTSSVLPQDGDFHDPGDILYQVDFGPAVLINKNSPNCRPKNGMPTSIVMTGDQLAAVPAEEDVSLTKLSDDIDSLRTSILAIQGVLLTMTNQLAILSNAREDDIKPDTAPKKSGLVIEGGLEFYRLSTYVRHCREMMNFSRSELARKVGVSDSCIYFIENGQTRSPRRVLLSRMAREFGVPEENLLILSGR
jgi:DNA-binding XRE family transcriptional regulator